MAQESARYFYSVFLTPLAPLTNRTLYRLEKFSGYVKLTFAKPLHFQLLAGSVVYIRAPTLSLYEFHPFSISTGEASASVSCVIKCCGPWTTNLYNSPESIDIQVFGCASACSQNVRILRILFNLHSHPLPRTLAGLFGPSTTVFLATNNLYW